MTTLPFIRKILFGLATALLCVAGVLVGCGGGGEGGVGTGGTGTYASGTITGFGSIIVNDVRFDDRSASVLDDDDGVRSRDQLKLGMTVAIDGSAIRSDAGGRSASASRIRIVSALVGPVSAVDTVAGTLGLLGQTVRVSAVTVLDDSLVGGLAGIAVGRTIEVYAQYDVATGQYDATRIEARDSAAAWQLRGPVAAIDTAAQRLRIGSASLDYAAASGVPPSLAVGDIVRLRVSHLSGAFGGWVVDAFGTGVRTPNDRDEAELKGRVDGFVSIAKFSVDGLRVDASTASFPEGNANLKPGARVEVRGNLRGGVLHATQVSIETEDEQRERGYELRGAIEALDRTAKTLTLRGTVVGWARTDLRVDNGTLADLAVGRNVEVKTQPDASRTGLEATRIKFD